MCREWLIKDKKIEELTSEEKDCLGSLFEKCSSLYDINAIKNSDRIILLYNAACQIVGYCAFAFHSDQKTFLEQYDSLFHPININKCIYIHQVFIRDDYRKKGCGKFLYENLISVSKSMDVSNLYAHVATTNIASKYFHSSLKFTCVGEYKRRDFYGCRDYHSLLLHFPVSLQEA